MKAGDLVTLSTYALCSEPMFMWKDRIWRHKKPLVGLVVKIEDNPNIRSWTSKNESIYYFINWMQKDGPASRWGSASIHKRVAGYFLRKDLKFVK
jgi:hypothetical protein